MKNRIVLATLLLAATLSACSEGEDLLRAQGGSPENPATPDDVVTPENPVIPAAFGWSTAAQVDLTLESPVETRISVFSDAACTDAGMLVLNAVLGADEPRLFPLTVPADAQTLYIRYPSRSGAPAVVPVRLAPSQGDASSAANYRFTADAIATTFEDNDGYTYYHNTGVVMVEDQWPDYSISDVDYNDLVMEYDMKVTECNVPSLLPAHGYKEGLLLTLDIRGIGSGRTQKAGLQILDFNPAFIQNVETIVYEKSGQGVLTEIKDNRFRIEVDKTQDDRVLILFDGLDNLVKGKHYQTTKGEIITGKPMIRAYIKLTGYADRSQLSDMESLSQIKAFRSAIFNTTNHDFFMVLKPSYGSAEIHQKGFEPTYRYTGYDADSKGLMSAVPYCSKKNEVWVLKVPAGTRHVYDRTSIFAAYPDIAGWIESDGRNNKEWYRNYVPEKVAPWW